MSFKIPYNTQANDFDVTKIATTLKATPKGASTAETRTLIDEREISLQMNIGLLAANTTTSGEGENYEFVKNNFTVTPNVIYNNCPDNIIQFIEMYAEKYNKFPKGNVTVTYYVPPTVAGDPYVPIMQSQGDAMVSFNTTEMNTSIFKGFNDLYTEAIAKMIKETGTTFDISTLDFDYKLKSSDMTDINFSSPPCYFTDGQGTTLGGDQVFLVFVPHIESPTGTETVQIAYKYGINTGTVVDGTFTSNTYDYGYVTIDQKKTGLAISYSEWSTNQRLGTVQFGVESADDTEQEYVISKMIFTPNTTAKTYCQFEKMDTLYVDGYDEGGELISGLTITSKHEGKTTLDWTDSSNPTSTNPTFEFQFTYKEVEGSARPKLSISFMKYKKVQAMSAQSTSTGTTYSLSGTTFTNFESGLIDDENGGSVYPEYMYLDHNLHLPEIYIEEETEEE